MLQGYCSHFA